MFSKVVPKSVKYQLIRRLLKFFIFLISECAPSRLLPGMSVQAYTTVGELSGAERPYQVATRNAQTLVTED